MASLWAAPLLRPPPSSPSAMPKTSTPRLVLVALAPAPALGTEQQAAPLRSSRYRRWAGVDGRVGTRRRNAALAACPRWQRLPTSCGAQPGLVQPGRAQPPIKAV
jgi:hypothetical protein